MSSISDHEVKCEIRYERYLVIILARLRSGTLRNYVKGVHKNNAVMSGKFFTLFVFSVEKYKFGIPK